MATFTLYEKKQKDETVVLGTFTTCSKERKGIDRDRVTQAGGSYNLTGLGYILTILVVILISFYAGKRTESYQKYTQVVREEKRLENERRLRDESIFRIRRYLESKASPLTENAPDFVYAGMEFNVDPRLLVAISGRESSFGKRDHGYNPFGIGGAVNLFHFTSYKESIYYLAELLSTSHYYSEWRRTGDLSDLAKVYCADVKAEDYASYLKKVMEGI